MPVEQKKTSIGDYNKIMSDRNIFNQTVYTLLPEALRLLKERQLKCPDGLGLFSF